MITRLRVRNFKSLHDIDLTLGSLNILVGPNMGGKSNILDVFRFLQEICFPGGGTDGVFFALANRMGAQEVRWKGGEESLISIAMEGHEEILHIGDWKYEIEILLGLGNFAGIQRESLSFSAEGGFKNLIRTEGPHRWLLNRDGKQLGMVGTESRSSLQNSNEAWDGHAFVKLIQSWRFHQLIPREMKQLNQLSGGQVEVLGVRGQNLSAWLLVLQTRFPDSFNKIVHAVRDNLPGVQGIRTWPTKEGTVHLASDEIGLKSPINVWQMSDGELAFVALLSLIYTPLEIGSALICIEEPENHLHPRLLAALWPLLRQVREGLKSSGTGLAQVIVTTQSPQVVDQARLDEIVWVSKSNGETTASHPSNQENLLRLVKDHEMGLSDIVYTGLLDEPI
jgi:predicted ATPase